jgi:predicted peroxiredoxin
VGFALQGASVREILADLLPRLVDLMAELRSNGGKVWLCGACTKPRGITEPDTAPGVTIVGAATMGQPGSDHDV